jgi:hypothetical protein
MSAKADLVSEIQSIFLEKDEIGNMMLDNLFGSVDEQIDLAEARIRRGERPSVVFGRECARLPTRPDRGATPTGKPWSAMTRLDRRAERAKVGLDDSRRLESKGVAWSLARQSQIDPRPLAKVAGRSQWRPFMFWFYWDTAWSVIISGIMFATIVAHPDAEVRETWRS